jgi:aldehyde:ferredoxin oxidoreductase
MGANLGISQIDHVVELNRIANEIGIDTIETGAALGVYAQTGQFHFGDGEKAIQIMREIQQDTELGRIIANGAVSTGRAFGIERIPAVKGQGMPGYDPRGTKGTGVTYATSPQGADHTCGTTIRANINQTGIEGQVDLSRRTQYKNAAVDNLGMCYFAAVVAEEKMIKDLIHSIYGWDVDDDYFLNLGKKTIQIERSINGRLGFTSLDDRIPKWMTRERIPPTDSTFDIPDGELDAIFN